MGQLRATLDEFDQTQQVGDWCFVSDDCYCIIRLHAGPVDGPENGVAAIRIKRDPDLPDNQAIWTWDGNRMAPTLSPSILHWGNGRGQPATWHGFLRAGQLVLA